MCPNKSFMFGLLLQSQRSEFKTQNFVLGFRQILYNVTTLQLLKNFSYFGG